MGKKVIFAFTGLMASGKGTAVSYFMDKHDAHLAKFSVPLRDILDRLYLEHTREHMQELSTHLRELFGQDILSKTIASDAQKGDHDFIVIDGVRRPLDIEHLKKLEGFVLVSVQVDQRTRYERLVARAENPGDAEKTFDEFKKDEQAEADALIPEVMKEADEVIDNAGSMDEFYTALESLYKKYA